MSIINTAQPGSQIRLLCLIDRVLNRRRQKPIRRDDLIDQLRPEALKATDNGHLRLPRNLDFWIEEGLWKSDESGISSQFITANENDLPARVLRLLIQNEKGNLLTGLRGEQCLLTITALLLHDQFTFCGNNLLVRDNVSNLVGPLLVDTKAGKDEHRTVNESEDKEVLNYGLFLGFLEPFKNGFILDPTRAITPVLPTLFNHDTRLRIKEFIARLAELLPMLDCGSYRQEVAALMNNIKGRNERHQISKALSHALIRLESSMTISFESLSDDSEALTIQHPDGTLRQVSLITLREVIAK